MQWRTTKRGTTTPRVLAAALVVCASVAAACGDEPGSIALGSAVTSTTATPATSTVAEATTAAPETVPPETVPPDSAPAAPVPGEHQGEGDTPVGPPPEVVRPPAAWVGFGIPQPGSMFENLQEDRSLDGKGKFVAFTFDDGPSQYTRPIVDILRFMGVQATFFQIADQALARQDEVRGMLFAGMRIGSHSRHHPHLPDVSPEQKRDEVVGTIDQMNATFGAGTVKCFRPPYADYDQQVLDLVAERGAATAMWSLDTLDWKKPAWQSLVVRVVNGAKDRQVILFHDGGGDRTTTILALPWIIQGLRDRGFQILPVC